MKPIPDVEKQSTNQYARCAIRKVTTLYSSILENRDDLPQQAEDVFARAWNLPKNFNTCNRFKQFKKTSSTHQYIKVSCSEKVYKDIQKTLKFK